MGEELIKKVLEILEICLITLRDSGKISQEDVKDIFNKIYKK